MQLHHTSQYLTYLSPSVPLLTVPILMSDVLDTKTIVVIWKMVFLP